MPTLEQVRAAKKKMRKAQLRVFDYVQGLNSGGVDPEKYHYLSEAARRAANRYMRLASDVNLSLRRPK